MHLDSLWLTNFKNIAEVHLEFSPKINCFLGNNGMGKSNLLDAVHVLSFTKSFTGMPDSMLIRRGEEFSTARALYTRRDTAEELTFGLRAGRRKSLKRGGKEYRRLTEHIGLFPLVLAAPHDIDLVRGSGEERRRWMDMVISQSDARYLDALIRYNAAIDYRNRLLRDEVTDRNLFLAVEMTLDATAAIIHRAREEWTGRLTELAGKFYRDIAGPDSETPGMRYVGSLHNSPDGTLASLLEQARRRDEILHHTSVGPHRDDIELTLDEMPARRAGSQGQCKTLTVALRLAQHEFLHQATGIKPMLLLDDIFDKLDASRVERIMALVTSADFGQIFITDTNRKHLDSIIGRTGGPSRTWSVEGGVFTEI